MYRNGLHAVRYAACRDGTEPAMNQSRAAVSPECPSGNPPRSVPEVAPTPLQRHYINLSVVALVAGAIAITALNLGAGPGSPVVMADTTVGR